MEILKFQLLWFPLLLFLFSIFVLATPHKIPRLSPLRRKISQGPDAVSATSDSILDFKTYYYEQPLDHFNYGPESYGTFKQKYAINTKYWGGANSSSPIFAYLGAEDALDDVLPVIGFPIDNAPRFKALLLYTEHRYYGESVPLGSIEEAMKSDTIRGYLSSVQAIADYAELLLRVKETYSAPNSPIVVFGGSYGGMITAWFRLKYPHVAIGALASSAPILYFDKIVPANKFGTIVTKDYKETSESCYETIRQSFTEIDKVASQSNGLSILSQRFKTCSPLNSSDDLKDFLELQYESIAQYNNPFGNPLGMICCVIDGAPNGTDILGRIFASVEATHGNLSCYDMSSPILPLKNSANGLGNELVLSIAYGGKDSIFPSYAYNLKNYISDCESLFSVPPRPHWVTTYYGGHDIKLVLQKSASNIIFSNGLQDPYSGGGVLEDLSDSLLAVYTKNGSHCLDLYHPREDDPEWLTAQRKVEVEIIEGWIAQYYADLHVIKDKKNFS